MDEEFPLAPSISCFERITHPKSSCGSIDRPPQRSHHKSKSDLLPAPQSVHQHSGQGGHGREREWYPRFSAQKAWEEIIMIANGVDGTCSLMQALRVIRQCRPSSGPGTLQVQHPGSPFQFPLAQRSMARHPPSPLSLQTTVERLSNMVRLRLVLPVPIFLKHLACRKFPIVYFFFLRFTFALCPASASAFSFAFL